MKNIFYLILLVTLSACGSTDVPTTNVSTLPSEYVHIYPDFRDATIPCNIQPMNFIIKDKADEFIVVARCAKDQIVVSSKDGAVTFPLSPWQKLMQNATGKNISIDIYARLADKWSKFGDTTSFTMSVSPDSIDPYITYRLIEPSYQASGEMGLYQLCLETGEETPIITTHMAYSDTEYRGQKCVNCHTTQRSNPSNRMFHYRGECGGMIVSHDGIAKKVNTKVGDMHTATTYPSWHPTLPLIALSANYTRQTFYGVGHQKLEVFDWASDLVLYDVEKNELSNIQRTKDRHETFPEWSADGKTLYYVASDSLFSPQNIKKMRYQLYSIPFDTESREWGEPKCILNTIDSSSYTMPRVSPEGNIMAITHAKYGVSTQFITSADLYFIDLQTMELDTLPTINSPETDSYHCWSSDGRWMLLASRREDNNYMRLFLFHVDKNGKVTKPFHIPQTDPTHDMKLIKSYNVAEFAPAPVDISVSDYETAIYRSDAADATFTSPINPDAVSSASKVTDGEESPN